MDLVFQRISFPWSKTFNTQPTEVGRLLPLDHPMLQYLALPTFFLANLQQTKAKNWSVMTNKKLPLLTTTYMQKQTTTESGASIKNQGCHHPWNLRQQRFSGCWQTSSRCLPHLCRLAEMRKPLPQHTSTVYGVWCCSLHMPHAVLLIPR